MRKKTVIFDFDGTIADTLDAIISIYNNIAPKYRCNVVSDRDKLSLQDKSSAEIMKFCGVNMLKLPLISVEVTTLLGRQIKDLKPISGIIDTLHEIKREGYRLGVMTSNSVKNVELFSEANGIKDLFDFIYSGKNFFGKDKVINRLMKEQGIDRSEAIYVGDETRDIEAVRKIKIPIVSVSWGFSSKQALLGFMPDQLAETPDQLLSKLNCI